MVAPYTGPFIYDLPDTVSSYREKRVYRQARPIENPLKYRLVYSSKKKYIGTDESLVHKSAYFWSSGRLPHPDTYESAYTDVIGKARERLRGEISSTAQWGTNLAEYQQALTMMTDRLHQVGGLLKSLIRGDFVTFSAILANAGNPLKRGKFATGRSIADTWLEFSFGWKPLVQDVFNAVDILQNPIKANRPIGTASDTWFYQRQVGLYPGHPNGYTLERSTGKIFAKMGCEVEISNPNLYLANQLGLTNPALIVWELIPFSFVVDWFTNVGQFLGQGSDFYGLSVKRPWTVIGFKGDMLEHLTNPWWGSPSNIKTWDAACLRREDSLMGVSLSVRGARLWGWQRCANAAAVVVQLLTRMGGR